MSSPFVAEIRIWACNFAPTGWAMCNGQLMPLSQNTALFSLLGTIYGGDGKSTFALPDLQGSAAMHWGQGAGLSLRDEGEIGGEQTVTLLSTEMPLHAHTFGQALNAGGGSPSPVGNVWAEAPAGRGGFLNIYGTPATGAVNPNSLSITGSSLPHNNLQPYLVLNFCIALQGIFPPRN
jgi:microcystin-dependent protein